MTSGTRTPSPLAQWREHLSQGRLAYQFDPQSQRAVFYPRVVAPGSGAALQWRTSRGLGTVYATTWVPARDGPPYNLALVDLDEGLRLMTRIEGLPAAEVAIGLRVKLRVLPASGDDAPLPLFEPVEAA